MSSNLDSSRLIIFSISIITLIIASSLIITSDILPWVNNEEPSDLNNSPIYEELIPVIELMAFQFGLSLNGSSNITLSQGIMYRFIVTSQDVSHGIALYNPESELISRFVAVPNAPTENNVTFESPGIYNLRCLEYCGIGHHLVAGSITVVNTNKILK